MSHYEDEMKGGHDSEQHEEQIPTPLGASLQQIPSAGGSGPSDQ